MIQTPLISTLPQAPSADGSATLLVPTVGGEGGVQPSGEGKAAFSQAMAMAQLMGKAPASQGNPPLQGPAEGAREGLAPAAKSLASDEPATESASSSKGADDEGELPPDDFLQQLQASLRQDVSLVVPPTSPAMAGEAAAPVDGNPLPPGAAAPGVAEDVGMTEGVEAAEGSASLPQMTPERQHEENKTKAAPGAAQGASAVPSGQGALPLGAEEPALADDTAVADQVGENRPLAESTVRREPQSLPHLKLATPEAPEQLHHKVNLMLADKLQQAEIQLDPLGLGKMKIQIQMDASSQASVHFVVQHGQTREMLEQAMPRLRDMLAGQGIQLGQTVVQQQAQQQAFQQQGQSSSQGQSGFGDQGRQGGNGGGSDGREAEGSARNLTLLVESANDAGIDFYA